MEIELLERATETGQVQRVTTPSISSSQKGVPFQFCSTHKMTTGLWRAMFLAVFFESLFSNCSC